MCAEVMNYDDLFFEDSMIKLRALEMANAQLREENDRYRPLALLMEALVSRPGQCEIDVIDLVNGRGFRVSVHGSVVTTAEFASTVQAVMDSSQAEKETK